MRAADSMGSGNRTRTVYLARAGVKARPPTEKLLLVAYDLGTADRRLLFAVQVTTLVFLARATPAWSIARELHAISISELFPELWFVRLT